MTDSSRVLSDEDIWLMILHPDVSAKQWARHFGVSIGAIYKWRTRFRHQGWTCRVRYGACVVCGTPLTIPGGTARRYFVHPACEPALRRTVRRLPRWATE